MNKAKEYIMMELRADWPLTRKELKVSVRNLHPDYCLKLFDSTFKELLESKEIVEYDPIPNDPDPSFMPNYDIIS